jgi:hypothetical protein
MTIKELYAKYHIMPQLQTHMLRVAGVGKIILSGWKPEINHDLVIRTLLLHDMGNITKFNLSDEWQRKMKGTDPNLDLPYWRTIQQKSWDTYGRDTHTTTNAIVTELGQLDVLEVLNQEHEGYAIGDENLILKQSDEAKIFAYCDVRVTPVGVTSMQERIEDLSTRYERELSWYSFLYTLEEQIRERTTVDLDAITEADVEPLFDELLTYTI